MTVSMQGQIYGADRPQCHEGITSFIAVLMEYLSNRRRRLTLKSQSTLIDIVGRLHSGSQKRYEELFNLLWIGNC